VYWNVDTVEDGCLWFEMRAKKKLDLGLYTWKISRREMNHIRDEIKK
jgi:hypothetical protein